MAADSILARTAQGAGWAIGWRVTTRLLGLVNTFVLVRLLLPGDFGLVALATGFSQGVSQISDLGIEEAVIRHRAPTRDTYDTAFTINVIRGVATALVLAAAAWPVAWFFSEPRLTGVLLVLAAIALVTSLENIGTIEFRRDFAFHREFRLLVLPRLASIAVTVTVGVLWQSHWALVAGIASGQLLWTVMGYAMHPHRPRLTLRAWRELAGFSFWSWAIGITVLLRDRVDGFVIGGALGVPQVGLFLVGTDIAVIPTYELAGPLSRAALPGFALALRNGASGADSYLRILAGALLLALPVGFGISLVADQVVLLALGPAWSAAVGIIRVVGIAGITFVLGTVTSSLLAAHGLLRRSFLIGTFSVAVRVSTMLLLVPRYGLTGAAYAWAISVTAENALNMLVAFRCFHIPLSALPAKLWRAGLAVAAMVAGLHAAGLGWTAPFDLSTAAAQLGGAVLLGATIYVTVLTALWLAVDRPAGGEADLLEFLYRLINRVRRGLNNPKS